MEHNMDLWRQMTFRRAVRRAYKRFARQHPRWANSLFDEYFLSNDALPILMTAQRTQTWPVALDLALAWLAQFRQGRCGHTPAQVAAALPVATAFLDCLQAECCTVSRK
jgi:hypothetical protein